MYDPLSDLRVFCLSEITDKYLLDPAAPLITVPAAVASLSTPALLHNIATHTLGTVNERDIQVKFLDDFLTTREADILARALVHQEALV